MQRIIGIVYCDKAAADYYFQPHNVYHIAREKILRSNAVAVDIRSVRAVYIGNIPSLAVERKLSVAARNEFIIDKNIIIEISSDVKRNGVRSHIFAKIQTAASFVFSENKSLFADFIKRYVIVTVMYDQLI